MFENKNNGLLEKLNLDLAKSLGTVFKLLKN